MDKEDILRKVRALLERADHPNTPEPEAESCRSKADQMMLVYSIESFELKTDDKTQAKPELRDMSYGRTGDAAADHQLAHMFYAMANHCGVKVGFFGWLNSKVVGYPSDLDYLDLMFTAVRMDLSGKINPKADPRQSLEDNVAKFKSAGWQWVNIYQALMAEDIVPKIGYGEYQPSKNGGPMFRAYKRWLKAHPDHQHIGENPKSYREGFVRGYAEEVQIRLYRMTRERKETVEEKGYGIVLRNRTDLLQDYLWEQFPNLRPHEEGCSCRQCNPVAGKNKRRVAVKEKAYSRTAYARGRDEGSKVNLTMGRNDLQSRPEIAQGS